MGVLKKKKSPVPRSFFDVLTDAGLLKDNEMNGAWLEALIYNKKHRD
jgi:hypothetical protein